MKKYIRKKLNRAGASLAEMLITVLIMSLVMVAVAGGVTTARRVYQKVRQKADAQTLLSTAINAVAGKLYYSYVWSYSNDPSAVSMSENGIGYVQTSKQPTDEKTTDESGTVDWIFSEGEGYIHIGNAGSTESTSSVKAKPVVTKQTQSLQQYAVLKDNKITYKDGCYSFTVQVIRDEKNEDNSVKKVTVEEQDVKIRTALSLD